MARLARVLPQRIGASLERAGKPTTFEDLAVYGTLTCLLVVPKVNLISVPGTYVGVKPEDFWVGALLVLGALQIGRGVSTVARYLWSRLTLASFFGLALIYGMHSALGSSPLAVFFFGRYAAYWALFLFFAGCRLAVERVGRGVIRLALGGLWGWACLAALQRGRIVGGWIEGTWSAEVARATAIFSHPTELGGVVGLLLPVLLGAARNWASKVFVAGMVLAINVLGENRAGLAGAAIGATLYFWAMQQTRRVSSVYRVVRKLFLLFLAGLGICVAGSVREDGWPGILAAAARCREVVAGAVGRQGEALQASGADEEKRSSLILRCQKWADVLHGLRDGGSVAWLIGLGPGSIGEAADSLVVRWIGEGGLTGVTLNVLFSIGLWKASSLGMGPLRCLKYGVLVLYLQGLILDVALFSRVAYLLSGFAGLVVGMAESRRRKLSVAQCTENGVASEKG
jgi:hypothetical protein